MLPNRRALIVLLFLAAAACHPDFQLTKFPTNEALYRAGRAEFAAAHWENAIAVFDKLTTDLPARDTLLPRAFWFLARAHDEQGEHILAATSYSRLVESFPDDSLADDAALASARAYWKMWRKPALDPAYGQTALVSYNTLLSLYPTSPLMPTAQRELGELEDQFAQKAYLSGMYYLRRKAYDSGIIYFKDILTKYPNAPTARSAQLRLVEAYKAIRYKEDASDACASLRKSFPDDAEVHSTCDGVAAPTLEAATPATSPPASTGPPVGTSSPVPPQR